jgi:hypothetical protein
LRQPCKLIKIAHVKLAEHEMQGTSARGMSTAKAVTDATAPLTATGAALWAAFWAAFGHLLF